MPHYRIETDPDTGALREVGVVDVEAPKIEAEDEDEGDETLEAPRAAKKVGDVLNISEEEEIDTPPQQPEDEKEEGPFICDAEGCGKPCSSKAGLAAHQRAKHAE